MKNTIIYLIGFAGAGKYTIAKEIHAQTNARLVDNHLINNPVFSVISTDGITPLPEVIWDKIDGIRRVVFDVIENISPADFSFIFTNRLVEGDPADEKLFAKIAELANKRNAKFIPVRRLCDEDELCRRVVSSDRKARLKDISPENARKAARTQKILNPDHPNSLNLDITELTVAKAAKKIIEYATSK